MKFDLLRWMAVPVRGAGVVEAVTGGAPRRFAIRFDGKAEGKALVLPETTTFTDGEVQRRTWRLDFQADGRFTGTAEGVVGGVRGTQDGHLARMRYRLRIEAKGVGLVVAIDDRFHDLGAGKVLNVATVSKLGLRVATISCLYEQEGGADAGA